MKLLLRKDVEKLGKAGGIVHVADGYARNYLLPRGLAVYVTPEGIRQIEIDRKKESVKIQEENANLQKLADKLRDFSCTVSAKTNEDGKLFGSVTAHMISKALEDEGFSIDESMIILDEPIKQCDVYNVAVSISPELKTNIKLWVVSDKDDEKNKDEIVNEEEK